MTTRIKNKFWGWQNLRPVQEMSVDNRVGTRTRQVGLSGRFSGWKFQNPGFGLRYGPSSGFKIKFFSGSPGPLPSPGWNTFVPNLKQKRKSLEKDAVWTALIRTNKITQHLFDPRKSYYWFNPNIPLTYFKAILFSYSHF